MGDFILFEEFFHLLGDHIAVVRDRDERDFLAGLRLLFGLRWLGLFGVLAHDLSIHHALEKKGSYSKASNDDFSGKVRLQLAQVTK